jgi:hypothetical protein
MLEKEFVSYNQALDLKALGFDYPTAGYYQDSRLIKQFPLTTADKQDQQFMRANDCSAPLRQQALRWFREKDCRFSIYLDWDSDKYMFDVFGPTEAKYGRHQFIFESEYEYDTYDGAENACIDKLIEILKNN